MKGSDMHVLLSLIGRLLYKTTGSVQVWPTYDTCRRKINVEVQSFEFDQAQPNSLTDVSTRWVTIYDRSSDSIRDFLVTHNLPIRHQDRYRTFATAEEAIDYVNELTGVLLL
jgi:hypothetical protein